MYEKKKIIGLAWTIFLVLALQFNAKGFVYTNETIDIANSGYYNSLDFENGVVHIIHINGTTYMEDVRYCNNTGGTWDCETAISNPGAFFRDRYTTIDVDSNGIPHIAWGHEPVSGVDLYYANKTGSSWSKEEIEGYSFQEGIYTSIAVDSNNKVHVADTNELSRLSYMNNAGGSWTNETLSLSQYFDYISLALNSLNIPYIAGRNKTASANKLALWIGGGSWSAQTFNEASDGWISAKFNSSDILHISHIQSGKLRHCTYSGSLSCEDVTDADNHTSLDIDPNGGIHITYAHAGKVGYCYYNGTWACMDMANATVSESYDRRIATGNNTAHISYFNDDSDSLNYMLVYFNESMPISITYDYAQGFMTAPDGNISITVSDEGDYNVTCFIQINEYSQYDNFEGGETNTYDINLTHGTNNVTVNCTDNAGINEVAELSFYVSLKNFILINEETGDPYTITNENITVYIPDRKINYTFNSSVNSIYYVSNASEDIRFNIVYVGVSGVITRDFNPLLTTQDITRVCVTPEQLLYEQLIYSSSSTRVAVYSVFADCYVLMDYTKYAYGDALMARAFTIPKMYELYTWSGGSKAVLSDLDGSVASEINLDLIEFAQREYAISILSEDISVSAYTNTTWKITYSNKKDTIDRIVIRIKEGSTVLLSMTETASPDDVTLYYDHSSYNLTDKLLTLEVEKYYDGDSVGTTQRLFYANGTAGFLNPEVAILLSAILLFFSWTFVSIRLVFGPFGIITALIGLAILTMAPANQYIIFMEVIEVICMVFMILIFKGEYAKYV